ncbi:polymorphic toxin-type HINT domain-containing protein, partial [Streptomyces sp. NPDC088400]|uniref:polymorphic toxin-type HINT domain-containing protein n=1 Tax=Streptomyces sp. NPDC088400 TaxID=3365861 RepID=UPI0037FD6F5C
LGLACGGEGRSTEGCGSGVVTHADGSLSKGGKATGGGVQSGGGALTSSRAGGGASATRSAGGGTKKKQQPVLAGIKIPTQQELFARGYAAYPDAPYTPMLMKWADGQCQMDPGSAFCAAANDLGWISPTKDFLELIGYRDAERCAGGSASGCAWTIAGLLPVGKLGKAGKLLKKCNSFLPETKILMADGTRKKIADVKVGDKVLATDPETGETAAKTVTAEILGNGLKDLVRVTVDIDGKAGPETASVVATDGHPFWLAELDEWIDATDLVPGQRLTTGAGTRVRIAAVERWTQPAVVHNLTVADLHTYYVLAGETPVLVHNSNGCVNWASNSVKTWGHTFKTHGAGAKNTKALTDRARSTGNQQGQWLDNDAAAEFLKGLHVEGAGPRSVRIPDGMGQVIMPDGSIVQARSATVVPSPNGLYKTGFPIIGPN